MTSQSYKRGGGIVPIAVLAAENGQTVAEAKQSLAELSASGVVRLATGPEGETARVRVTQYLTVLNEDGASGCHMLFLARPASALPASKRRGLAEMLARMPDATLGAVATLCAAVRLADRTGFVASGALEDYLGVKRGSLSGGEGGDEGGAP